MDKGKLDEKGHTPKGKIFDGREPCMKCGVCRLVEKMNKVTSPDGSIHYICARCLHQ